MKLLKDRYYIIMKENRLDANNGVYLLSLLPQSDVYRGHFPNQPVCPGVCSIQMIRECVEMLTGCPLYIKTIKQCRFTALLTPQCHSLIDVVVSVARLEGTDTYSVTAKITNQETTFVELKGDFARSL